MEADASRVETNLGIPLDHFTVPVSANPLRETWSGQATAAGLLYWNPPGLTSVDQAGAGGGDFAAQVPLGGITRHGPRHAS